MTRQLDIGSANPRLQCAGCGKWMRLHGVKDGQAIQRFNGSCDVTLGDHPLGGEVCTECCPTKCRACIDVIAAEQEERRKVFGPFAWDDVERKLQRVEVWELTLAFGITEKRAQQALVKLGNLYRESGDQGSAVSVKDKTGGAS